MKPKASKALISAICGLAVITSCYGAVSLVQDLAFTSSSVPTDFTSGYGTPTTLVDATNIGDGATTGTFGGVAFGTAWTAAGLNTISNYGGVTGLTASANLARTNIIGLTGGNQWSHAPTANLFGTVSDTAAGGAFTTLSLTGLNSGKSYIVTMLIGMGNASTAASFNTLYYDVTGASLSNVITSQFNLDAQDGRSTSFRVDNETGVNLVIKQNSADLTGLSGFIVSEVIPEPSSAAFIGLAGVTFLFIRRK